MSLHLNEKLTFYLVYAKDFQKLLKQWMNSNHLILMCVRLVAYTNALIDLIHTFFKWILITAELITLTFNINQFLILGLRKLMDVLFLFLEKGIELPKIMWIANNF